MNHLSRNAGAPSAPADGSLPSFRCRRSSLRLHALMLGIAGLVPLAQAASGTWSGAADSTWSSTSNWSASPVPGAGNTATFNGAGNGNTVIDLGSGVTLSSLVFDTSSAAAYTIGSGAVGGQTLTIGAAGTAIQMNSTVANNQLINANLAFGANAITVNNSSTTNSLTIAGNLTGSAAFTKTGAGTLALSGTNSPTGNLVLSAGRLNITGGTTNFGGGFSNLSNTSSTTAVANISAGATLGWTGANGGNFGSASGASGALYNSGNFNQSATTVNNAGIYLGNAANTYGYLRNSTGATTTVSGRLWVAQAANAAGAAGVVDITGGTVSVNPTANFTNSARLQINGDNNTHATSTSYAGVNITGGTLTVGGNAQTNINTGQNEYTSINITGTGKWTAGASGLDAGIGLGVTSIATNTATLAIANGGTLETSYIYNSNALGTGVITFDNGTIRSLFNNSTGLIQGTNTKTYIQAGGATFDTNGFNTIVQNPLLAPVGNGVGNITLGGTATGYVGAPVVKISGGGGIGAAAIANFDPATGTVTGITITSPGSGYTSAPTITLAGGNGGSTGAGVGSATATASVGAVTGGGLTKTGAGTLTLSAANTYVGGTTVNAGTLDVTGSLADTGAVTVNGGTYKVSADDTVGAVTLAGGTISNATGKVLTGSSYAMQSGTVGAILGGTGALSKTTAGTVTLSGVNTYTGDTTISAGTLALASTGSIAGSTTIIANGTFDVSAVSGFTIGSGQTLRGSGAVTGATTVNGILAPGNSPGLLTFSSNLTLAGTSQIEINGTSRGSSYDAVNVGGALTYGGTLSLFFDAPIAAGTYDLFGASTGGSPTSVAGDFGIVSVAGSFAENFTTGPAFVTGGGWSADSANWHYIFDNASGDLTVSAVPEPSAFAALAGLATLAVVGARRRRR